MKSKIVAASLSVFSQIATLPAESLSVNYPAGPGMGMGKPVVLIAGDEEYRSEDVMPMLGKILSQKHGFNRTILFSVSPEGTIDPNAGASLTNPETLDSADAIVMLTRFRKWPDEAMKHFDDAMRRGVPVIGLRTSTHAFQLPATSNFKQYNTFGKEVLGEKWVSHWGKHKSEATRGMIESANATDPMMYGFNGFTKDVKPAAHALDAPSK